MRESRSITDKRAYISTVRSPRRLPSVIVSGSSATYKYVALRSTFSLPLRHFQSGSYNFMVSEGSADLCDSVILQINVVFDVNTNLFYETTIYQSV